MTAGKWSPWPADIKWSFTNEQLKYHPKAANTSTHDLTIPVTYDIPWLFPEPQKAMLEWHTRIQCVLADLTTEGDRATAELRTINRDSTSRRLQRLIQAIREQKKLIEKLMAPLDLNTSAPPATYRLTQSQIAASQSLLSYFTNIFRDWCWGNEENILSRDIILKAAADIELGKCAVLGAGSCRLPYDLFQYGATKDMLAIDINPLLFHVARKVMAGKKVHLYEFPQAPTNMAAFAQRQTLAAPTPVGEGFKMILADALKPPLEPGQFDTILTPWFIDIVHEPFPHIARTINQLLKPGGRWINFGSLVFFHSQHAICFSREEIPELLLENGFEQNMTIEQELPYLDSPLNCQRRLEKLLCFSATKKEERCPEPEELTQPPWLHTPELPIPILPDFPNQILANKLFLDIFTRIDGKKNMVCLAEEIAPVLQLSSQQSISLLQQVLTDMYTKNLKSQKFK